MGSILFSLLPLTSPNYSHANHLLLCPLPPTFSFISRSYCPPKRGFQFRVPRRSQFSWNSLSDEGDSRETVEVLRVPEHWLEPSTALQESEWLRVTLHKWLDDEYCPEPTNVDISRIAANSYYQSLLQKTTDLGEILLRMIRELETISYQESFHGAFSSGNAAVTLIAERIECG